ncbi:iron-siderophore ABC transporter substrate-binding protein [Mobilicoccus massiliensis]|uniref:iron-siderophore ABC transporter substrate-binding protein n=1 Tax=Mobilicoccus massiliensis TaxID=1522310 RepID=UPI00058BBCD4|nr:iron-siderophore ABC transporter substrate-binding protein [Mobilicoccus massiliensis]
MSPRRLTLVAATIIASLGPAACGSDSTSGATAPTTGAAAANGSDQAFPVTLTHAFGQTTIEKKPERVASVAWGNHEVPLALGIVPVGMSKATWGDDDKNGMHPWVEAKLSELGGATPALFDDTDSIDYEAVSATKPDVILAAYSGLTKEQYDTLSKIAPVVAYPEQPWGTSMNEMIRTNATAIGKAAEGERLAKDLDAQIAQAAKKHPDLAGKGALFSFIDPSDLGKIGFYNENDPRVELWTKLGMKVPAQVAKTKSSPEFWNTVSAESSDTFSDVDLLVTYGKDPATTTATVQKDPLWSKIPAVKNGAVAVLPDDTPLAASANPSPLNVPWGLEKYLAVLDQAAAKAK